MDQARSALEFLLRPGGPLQDARQEVRRAARTAALEVGGLVERLGDETGALALIEVLQGRLAMRKRGELEQTKTGGGKEAGEGRHEGSAEENEAVLGMLAKLSSRLSSSDHRIVAIAQSLLASVSASSAASSRPKPSSSCDAESTVRPVDRAEQAQLARCLIPLARYGDAKHAHKMRRAIVREYSACKCRFVRLRPVVILTCRQCVQGVSGRRWRRQREQQGRFP